MVTTNFEYLLRFDEVTTSVSLVAGLYWSTVQKHFGSLFVRHGIGILTEHNFQVHNVV